MKKPSSNRDAAPEVGVKINRLTFMRSLNEKDKWTNFLGEWQCDCGNVSKLAICLVKRKTIQSCGCVKRECAPTEIGMKLYRLTLLSLYPKTAETRRRLFGLWRCDCGVEKRIRVDQVKNGNTTSCGCAMKHEAPRIRMREYYIYHNILKRCYDPATKNYKDYGGRGIVMCQRWFENVQHFLDDMGPRPSIKHSIERKDNDGPYSPDNCIWATRDVQARNKRDTIKMNVDGVVMCQKDFANLIGICDTTVIQYRRKGWTPEQIRDHFAQRKAA